jgi:NitT/TauT family transport system substrate-binding protein
LLRRTATLPSRTSSQGEHLKLLLQGAVDVTTAASDAVLARRAEDIPIVAIALLGQRSDRAYAVQASSNIHSPKDFEGKLVGFKVYPTPDYVALLSANGVNRSLVQEVPVGFDPRLLAAGRVDVYPVFESNEPLTLERLGVPVRLFRLADYGVPGLGLTYIARSEQVQSDPDGLQRFLKATLRGIEFARANPEAATDIIMRYAPQEDRDHQLGMLKIELDMAESDLTRTHGIGWSTAAQWQALHDSLLAFEGLDAPLDVTTAFDDRILRAIYREGNLQWP